MSRCNVIAEYYNIPSGWLAQGDGDRQNLGRNSSLSNQCSRICRSLVHFINCTSVVWNVWSYPLLLKTFPKSTLVPEYTELYTEAGVCIHCNRWDVSTTALRRSAVTSSKHSLRVQQSTIHLGQPYVSSAPGGITLSVLRALTLNFQLLLFAWDVKPAPSALSGGCKKAVPRCFMMNHKGIPPCVLADVHPSTTVGVGCA